jgi:hypothetical protein
MLPDGKGASTPAALHRSLVDLRASPIMNYCCRGSQGLLEALLDKISNLKMGIPVSLQTQDLSDFFKLAPRPPKATLKHPMCLLAVIIVMFVCSSVLLQIDA